MQFPDVADGDLFTVLFMMAVYGYILFKASNLIADGSDILREIYGAGIVGGILIPILGALPDGLIILFSGMGDGTKKEIQEGESDGYRRCFYQTLYAYYDNIHDHTHSHACGYTSGHTYTHTYTHRPNP